MITKKRFYLIIFYAYILMVNGIAVAQENYQPALTNDVSTMQDDTALATDLGLVQKPEEEKVAPPQKGEVSTEEDAIIAEALILAAEQKKAKKLPLTQTQAHLLLPATQKRIAHMGGLAKNKIIFAATQKKERELQDYYVFYTAVPYMRLFQDVTRKMHKSAIGRLGGLAKGQKAFQFLRFTHKDTTYGRYKNATDFLLKEVKENGLVDDNEVRLKTILVSTNLALLGNTGFTGESTWFFFNNPQPWGQVNDAFLRAALESYDYSTEFIPQLLELLTYLRDKEGNLSSDLFQIFIPTKQMTDDIGYLSWRLGIPFDTLLIPLALGRKKMTFGVKDALSYLELKDRVAQFRTRYQAKEPDAVHLVNKWLKNIAAGKYHLAEYLDRFKKDPESIRVANYAQGRLLLTNDALLNPASGVLIFRYSTLPYEKEVFYKAKLREIFASMDQERTARLTHAKIKVNEVTDSLIQDAKAAAKNPTQSQAHLNVPFVQTKVKELGWLDKNESIIKEILQKEKGYPNLYCFYTAVPSAYQILQDVTRKLYKVRHGKKGGLAAGKKSFQFIRYALTNPIYNKYKNVTEFLTKEFTTAGIVDDNLSRIKTILVATNLALFGNVGLEGESTYHYFNQAQPWATAGKSLLEECLKSFGYSTAFADELLQVAQLIQSNKGMILQYFIPPKLVNSIGYKSWRQGIPFDEDFIKKLFGKTKLTFGRSDQIFSGDIDKAIAQWKSKYAAKDADTVGSVKSMLSKIARGQFHLYPFIDQYKKNPISLNYANFFQARLLVSDKYLLNPASGILVYRYTHLDKEKEELYKQKLNEVISKIVGQEPEKQKQNVVSKQVTEAKKRAQELLKRAAVAAGLSKASEPKPAPIVQEPKKEMTIDDWEFLF